MIFCFASYLLLRYGWKALVISGTLAVFIPCRFPNTISLRRSIINECTRVGDAHLNRVGVPTCAGYSNPLGIDTPSLLRPAIAYARVSSHDQKEDLNVKGMMRNHRLAKSIADASFGEFRRQLTYKSEESGCRLVTADRFFPSSKICSVSRIV
jgi:hypothetical protein